MRSKAFLVSRLLMGLIFLILGLNGLFYFLSEPPPADNFAAFINGLNSAHYFRPLLGLTQTVGGALLLLNIGVPFALVLLAPVTVNVIFFHSYFTPAAPMLVVPSLVLVMHVFLASCFWDLYRPLFSAKFKRG